MNKNLTATLAAAAAFLFFSAAHAQTVRAFTPRYSDNTRGKLTFVSNSIITTKGSGLDFTALPPGCGTATNCKDDGLNNGNIDVDGDPSTPNSSSATLTLPACNTVAYAGLYWGAACAISQGTNGATPFTRTGREFVRFKAPGASAYATLTAQTVDTFQSVFQGFQAYADVTTLVQAAGAGSYTVADVKCDTDRVNSFGGWTMVVVYRDSTQPTRNLTVFDGLSITGTGGTATASNVITLTGFHAPPTGAVAAMVGVVCYDGDRGSTDSFSIRRNDNGVFVDQTTGGESADATSNTNDSWNSSITIDGANVTTRNPAYANTYGYDADLFTLQNAGKTYLRNNDSSLIMRIGTPSEGYVLGVVATQVDVYAPELLLESATTDLNGASYSLGDTLLVTLSVRNTGTDTAVGARIVERLSSAFQFVPGTLAVDGIPRTDAAGDDVAEYSAATKTIVLRVGTGATSAAGGTIRSNGTDRFTASYRVRISTDCDSVGVTPATLSRHALILFGGMVDADPDTAAARPLSVGGCTQGPAPDALTVPTGCLGVPLAASLLHFGYEHAGDDAVVLQWRVSEHNNIAAYEVSASTDGREFAVLETVRVQPSTGVRVYGYTDARPHDAPRIHYRLGLRDLSGALHQSRVLVVENESAATAVPVLYPNPGSTMLRVQNLPAGAAVRVYDVQGRCVISDAANAAAGMATTALRPGVYFVRIASANNSTVLRWVRE